VATLEKNSSPVWLLVGVTEHLTCVPCGHLAGVHVNLAVVVVCTVLPIRI